MKYEACPKGRRKGTKMDAQTTQTHEQMRQLFSYNTSHTKCLKETQPDWDPQFCTTKKNTQEAASKAIMNLVVKCSLPLPLVEKEPFKDLVLTLSSGNLKSISRKNLCSKIDEQLDVLMVKFKETFSSREYVCTTADIWSSRKKSFLGMTAHFLDHNTLQRHLM